MTRARPDRDLPPVRTLVLVRHGQFSASSLGLTRLGREQAVLTARRLRAFRATKIHTSTMKRAYETALIIARYQRRRAPIRAHLLRECLPTVPRSRMKSIGATAGSIRRGKDRADRAYRRYFKRPVAKSECELLVCHGNIIRYLLERALGFRKHAWYRLGTSHCGVSVVRIPKRGAPTLLRYNDVGHIPEPMVSS